MKKNSLSYWLILLFVCVNLQGLAQGKYTIKGRVICDDMDVLGVAQVFLENTSYSASVDDDGYYVLNNVKSGDYTVVAFAPEHQSQKQDVKLIENQTVNFHLHEYTETLETVEVVAQKENRFGISRLNGVEGFGIYEGKKTEVVIMEDVLANKATNNARQVFSRVSGLNIWESDCAGIQLGVGGRGLSPNRSSNFNVRQNGIEMSADALGYPESYYSPPLQAVKRIEVVRGAASLQYGTQFGGLINFELKEAPNNKKIGGEASVTYGAYDYFNAYTSLGGTSGKLNYYGYYQYRTGDCWRCNSEFDTHSAYFKVGYDFSEKFSVSADYSKMFYLARQPGGLTDEQFSIDPQASYRDRNWFRVNWNLFSLNFDVQLSKKTRLNSRFFGLLASREALGNLERIDRVDSPEFDRTLLDGRFKNFGNETRVLHHYSIGKQLSSFLVGVRIYQGNSLNKDGLAPNGSDPDFRYLNPDSLSYEYDNGGKNLAVFGENIFSITDKFSVTPGFRYEYIETSSEGYFSQPIPRDLAGNPLIPDSVDNKVYDQIAKPRSFVLLGLGVSFKPTRYLEFYGNFSQNYKSISFSDIRVTTPTLEVDPDIKDENGFSVDIGARGTVKNFFSYEITTFLLKYNDRIGSLLMRDESFRVYRYRTNVGDATNIGVETFAEIDLLRWLKASSKSQLAYFVNFTWLHARYTNAPSQIEGNKVEFSPDYNVRTGLTYRWNKLAATVQISYLSDQFSDATNASNEPPVPGAVEGTIPAYYVADFTAEYQAWKWLKASFSLNNFTDHMYFTRRATGYPGPGIIPSEGRTFYVTLTGTF